MLLPLAHSSIFVWGRGAPAMPPAARALPRQELAILPVCVGGGCPLPFNPLGLATLPFMCREGAALPLCQPQTRYVPGAEALVCPPRVWSHLCSVGCPVPLLPRTTCWFSPHLTALNSPHLSFSPALWLAPLLHHGLSSALHTGVGEQGWDSPMQPHLSHPQAGVPRATPEGLSGDGLQVSLQRADAGADTAGQRPH